MKETKELTEEKKNKILMAEIRSARQHKRRQRDHYENVDRKLRYLFWGLIVVPYVLVILYLVWQYIQMLKEI